MFKKLRWFCCLCFFCLPFAVSSSQGFDTILIGAGATFPFPLYEKWTEVYRENAGVRLDYQAVGSGAGIQKLLGRHPRPSTDIPSVPSPG